MSRGDDAARTHLVALLAANARRDERLLVLASGRAHERGAAGVAHRAQAQKRRRAAEQETADPYTAPRKEEPKRTLEDDYLDFMNRYK